MIRSEYYLFRNGAILVRSWSFMLVLIVLTLNQVTAATVLYKLAHTTATRNMQTYRCYFWLNIFTFLL